MQPKRKEEDPPTRILLVEDNTPRYKYFQSIVPAPIRLVWARTGGSALHILDKDEPDTYAGIMLDFDLYEQNYTLTDRYTNGGMVAEAVAKKIFNDVPILVHSMNPRGAERIVSLLEGAGFPVTRIPFGDMTHEKFLTWVASVGS